MKKRISTLLCSLLMIAVLLTGCGKSDPYPQLNANAELQATKDRPIATLSVKDFGDIRIVLYGDLVPKAVENFVTHAENGYYDGLTFHRVIEGFMIQGGDPNGNGTGGESIWGGSFPDEITDQLFHFRGAIAYANSGPDTNGSQFYIVQNSDGSELTDEVFDYLEQYAQLYLDYEKENKVDLPQHPLVTDYTDEMRTKYRAGGAISLDGSYTIFGQVIEGMDVVDAIAASPVQLNPDSGEESVPEETLIIEHISIDRG